MIIQENKNQNNWNTACKIIDEVQYYIDRGEMLYDIEIIEIIQSILDARLSEHEI